MGIMQGQPLSNEEIAAMTGAPQQAAPVITGAQSFVMPDMFASPGLTMVGGTQGEFNAAPATASTVATTTAAMEPPPATSAKKSDKKKSDKKSSKKRVSSKKKSKGCC